MKKLNVMVIVGTRPEVIKMAPVVAALQRYPDEIKPVLVSTSQHREMLDQVLHVFKMTPDIDLNIMQPNQSLSQITQTVMMGIEKVLDRQRPDIILIQGDTTTVFATSLAAYYTGIPVGHVEAGLRSFDRHNPYPEELNRCLTSVLADLHFAPTARAEANLLAEGIPKEKIFITGNTVVDALKMASAMPCALPEHLLRGIDLGSDRLLLVTAHRRESWGSALEKMCLALADLAEQYKNLWIIYPVHLNPSVRKVVFGVLQDIPRIRLVEPLDYLTFLHLMKKAYVILTDSGGIQEEAPSLGKPVLVLRNVTERPEAFEAGYAKVIGSTRQGIVDEVTELLDDSQKYQTMVAPENPYGDGKASDRIVRVVLKRFQIDTDRVLVDN